MMLPIDDELEQYVHATAQQVRAHSGSIGYLLFWLHMDKQRTPEGRRKLCDAALLKIRVEQGGHNDAD